MIPNHLRPFFWDIDIDGFDPFAYPRYTIGRLLEYGNPEAISWLKKHFYEEAIKTVVRTERTLSPKSANFWGLVYNIASTDIAALNRKDAGTSTW
jgi:hypothetical protein